MYAKGTRQYEARERRRAKFRRIRISILLVAFLAVGIWGLDNYLDDHHTFAWDEPVRVTFVALIDGKSRSIADGERFIQRFLSRAARPDRNLLHVEEWFQREYARHTGIDSAPLSVSIRGPVRVDAPPPALPTAEASFFERYRGTQAFLEYFTEIRDREDLLLTTSDVVLFLYFYDDYDQSRRDLFGGYDSVATRRSRMGVVFAPMNDDRRGHTCAIVAHELCHPLGASDKYDGVSVYPGGYVEPDREPRYPQPKAEIMALGRPVSESVDAPVRSLDDCAVGGLTAREINWTR